MAYGTIAFYYLAKQYGEYASYVAIAIGTFVTTLYILDFDRWQGRAGDFFRKVGWVIFNLSIALLVLLTADSYAYGPICLFSFVTPMWLVLMKGLLYSKVRTRVYVSWLTLPLFFIGFATGIVWLVWTFLRDENEWNNVTQISGAEEVGCEPNFEVYPECEDVNNPGKVCVNTEGKEFTFSDGCQMQCIDVYDSCLNTFILWVGPLLVSLVLLFLSFFCTFLRTKTDEKDIANFGKLWIFLLFTVWLTASLAGVGAGVSSALFALTLASFVGSTAFIVSSVSRATQKTTAETLIDNVSEKMGSNFDWVRGLMVVTCGPFAIIYFFLSFFNQLARKIGLPCCKRVKTPEEKKDYITKMMRRQIDTFRSWNRSRVYFLAVLWGFAYMVLVVIVAKFTVLFLSWLIEETSSMSLAAVTGIMVGVGLILFMLPPVPGVPIYLALGIVVIATGRDLLGIIGSIFYAAAVSLFLKLFACTLQQKMIGGALSNYVSIRKVVGINSNLIKAMRLILRQKGFSPDKVTILVGGPDWPTSVLCGIMNLDLLPILVGTLPVIFLIMPTLLTGSFTYMASLVDKETGAPEFPWAGVMAAVAAAATAVVQCGSMIFAAYYLEQTASQRADELDLIPVDTEVRELEDKEEYLNRCYIRVTRWPDVPLLAKLILQLSLISMTASCYLVTISPCFAEYQLTYTIDEHLEGNWLNLVLPLGWIAILLFTASCVLLYIYYLWANLKAKRLMNGAGLMEEEIVAEAPSDERANRLATPV